MKGIECLKSNGSPLSPFVLSKDGSLALKVSQILKQSNM
jgi:hypothetical protein